MSDSKKILGVDPGAKRCGLALVASNEGGPLLIDSWIQEMEKEPGEKFGEYRRRLVFEWTTRWDHLIVHELPNVIVSETLPITGPNNTQRVLGLTVVTVGQVIAQTYKIPWVEVAANTVKKIVTGNGTATKVRVRDAVIYQFPELAPRKKELTTYADEADAISIALAGHHGKYAG